MEKEKTIFLNKQDMVKSEEMVSKSCRHSGLHY